MTVKLMEHSWVKEFEDYVKRLEKYKNEARSVGAHESVKVLDRLQGDLRFRATQLRRIAREKAARIEKEKE